MSASPDLLQMKGQFPMQFEDMEAVPLIEASLSEEQYPHTCQWDDEKPAGRYHNSQRLPVFGAVLTSINVILFVTTILKPWEISRGMKCPVDTEAPLVNFLPNREFILTAVRLLAD
jgi:hypothetical protein